MSTIAVGDEVALPQGQRAILRWIGRIPGRPPVEYAGVEVLGPDAEKLGKHSGMYQGQRIFETSRPGTGLFVSYTQLVGANVRSGRVETPRRPRVAAAAAASPGAYDAVSPSPRYHKPPARGQPLAAALDSAGASTAAGTAAGAAAEGAEGAEAGQLDALRAENARLRAENAARHKELEIKRRDFRAMLGGVNERLDQLGRASDARIAELRSDYEEKLRSARRSSSLAVAPGDSEVEEQRLALAAMQNKIVAERSEKQREIDALKRDLAHARRITGGAEDLEALVRDLGSMEQQLKDMRAKVEATDALQRELESLRVRNAELELAVRAEAPRTADSSAADAVSREEYARLEQALETRLLRESELEARSEQLEARSSQLEKRSSELETRNEQLLAELAELRLQAAHISEAARSDGAATSAQPETPAAARDGAGQHTPPSARSPGAGLERRAGIHAEIPAENPAESRAEDHSEDRATQAPSDEWDLTADTQPNTKPPPLAPAAAALPADESSQFADLAAGRTDWCSLCERQGHSAIDCPFI